MTVVVFGVLATLVAFLSATMPGPVSQVGYNDYYMQIDCCKNYYPLV